MKSLFARMIAAFLIAQTVFIVFAGLAFSLAVNRSISGWDERKREDLRDILASTIAKTYRMNGSLTERNLAEPLDIYLTDSLYVYVLDAGETPLFLYDRGERIDPRTAARGGPDAEYIPIKDGSLTIAFVATDLPGFQMDEANRSFLRTMSITVLEGAILAFLVAAVLTFFFSGALSRQARIVAGGIGQIARGKRDVHFPSGGAKELAEITLSAEVLQNRLRKEEELRRQWACDISHDLRTPVTAMKFQFEGMIDDVLKIDKARISSLLGELGRLEKLIDDLRELSRIESPEMRFSPELVDAEVFATDALERFAPIAAQRGTTIAIGEARGFLFCDPHLLTRCVSNIVQNAIQYAAPPCQVTLSITGDPAGALIQVDNSGTMRKDDMQKVFDRLWRGSSARGEKGSGLGLSIAKAIADRHGGRIDLKSEDGITTFALRLPPRGIETDRPRTK